MLSSSEDWRMYVSERNCYFSVWCPNHALYW